MGHAGVELGLAGLEHGVIDGDAGVLHDGQGRGHGHLQVGEEPQGITSHHLLIEHDLEREQGGGPTRTGQVGCGNGLGGEGLEVEGALGLTGTVASRGSPLVDGGQIDAEPALGEGVDVVAALFRATQVAGQGGICDDAVEREPPGAQRVPAALGVGDELGALHVGQEPGQGGFILRQDLGEVDDHRPRAVGQRHECGIALDGSEDADNIDPQGAGAVITIRRQTGLQPFSQLPRGKIVSQRDDLQIAQCVQGAGFLRLARLDVIGGVGEAQDA